MSLSTRVVYHELRGGSGGGAHCWISRSGAHAAHFTTLKANTPWATNSITNPTRIVPVQSKASISGNSVEHTVPAYSIEVLEVDLK